MEDLLAELTRDAELAGAAIAMLGDQCLDNLLVPDATVAGAGRRAISAKTLRNHKSNTKSALLWLANERGVPRYGTKLTPAWERLQKAIEVDLVRWRIYAFARFCSANTISPER